MLPPRRAGVVAVCLPVWVEACPGRFFAVALGTDTGHTNGEETAKTCLRKQQKRGGMAPNAEVFGTMPPAFDGSKASEGPR